MRLEPSDPDIETVVTRIERGDLDLQPAFQRGEVWSKTKKQRLIDSILREWHIPPIHVIELKQTRKQEVLDGQQRLAAIRDFVRGDFAVDGEIEPLELEIQKLGGKKYRELPDDWKRKFNQFTLRVFRIVEYRAEEPGELFFRLNQPTSLTAAEQRNAFFGPVRAQIKTLVAHLESSGLDKGLLGFSNSRMAYDDVVARVCLTVKRQTLTEKVTAADLVDLYRSEESLSDNTIFRVRSAIDILGGTRSAIEGSLQLNKATVYSWFLFSIRALGLARRSLSPGALGRFMMWYEKLRVKSDHESTELVSRSLIPEELLRIYSDRSASRVADVSSVILRDAILWFAFSEFLASPASDVAFFPPELADVHQVRLAYENAGPAVDEDLFARGLIENGWGSLP
jgi:hypothetical protein